jgi:hypothetical protein
MTTSQLPTFSDAEPMLHAAACKETGLDDFGDASYLENLKAYLRALDQTGRISVTGREIIRAQVIGLLKSRLYVQAAIKANPQLLDIPIKAPVFILGLPRTGTTALQNMLMCDPQFQGLQLWLTQEPMPRPPISEWKNYSTFQQAQAGLDAFYTAVPELKAMHWMAADEVDECRAVLSHTFANVTLSWPSDLDIYAQWLYQHDMTQDYRYFADVLRVIGANEPQKTWVLKCPSHSISADKLLNVFPDARLIFLHRDPASVVPSISSMVYKLRTMTEGEKTRPERCGEQMLNNLDYAMKRLLAVRDQRPENFMNLRFVDFMADPVGSIKNIYDRFGLEWQEATAESMRGWLRDNPAGKHGSHQYAPEDFGLTREKIHERFDYYHDY